MFGDEVYQGFLELKNVWDPDNILNPGKVVNAPDLDQDLRWGADYQTVQIRTHLDFSREGGFARAIEMCNGAGVCRKRQVGTMCPSYQATLEEEHSTRGRANLLRAALSGKLPAEEFTSERMHQALDLCLECKGCKRECPSNVDLAKIKYEFLAQYYARHGTPLKAKFFGRVETLNRWGSRFAGLANWATRLGAVKKITEAVLGVDARRELPPFAAETFEAWHRKRPKANGEPRRRVALFHDCFLNYNYPQVGRAATELLEAAGFEVILPGKVCCGRPMISKGLLEEARKQAEANVRLLERLRPRRRSCAGRRAELFADAARRVPRFGSGRRGRGGRVERVDDRRVSRGPKKQGLARAGAQAAQKRVAARALPPEVSHRDQADARGAAPDT